MYDSYIVLVRSYFYIIAALAKELQNNTVMLFILQLRELSLDKFLKIGLTSFIAAEFFVCTHF